MRFDDMVGIKDMISESASGGQSQDKFCPAFGSRTSMIASAKPVWIVNVRGFMKDGTVWRREEVVESTLDESMALRHGGVPVRHVPIYSSQILERNG
eukprot:scaffold284399_cov33-Attheya_sp.AAC.1